MLQGCERRMAELRAGDDQTEAPQLKIEAGFDEVWRELTLARHPA